MTPLIFAGCAGAVIGVFACRFWMAKQVRKLEKRAENAEQQLDQLGNGMQSIFEMSEAELAAKWRNRWQPKGSTGRR